MGMLLFSLLLIIPLISAADPTGDLGFDCDEKKCIFSLVIPQSAIKFVDVDFLRDEIAGLSQNVTELVDNEGTIHDDEDTFNGDFASKYSAVQDELAYLFETSFDLNATSADLIVTATVKETKAKNLNDALACMVKGVESPKDCGEKIPDNPTTPSPAEPTDDGSKTEGPTEAPFTGSTTTPEPFTGTTTTEEPFTGTTTTEAPYTGTTTTEAPFTGSTEEKPTTTPGPEVTEGSGSTTDSGDGSTTDQSSSSSTDSSSPSTCGPNGQSCT